MKTFSGCAFIERIEDGVGSLEPITKEMRKYFETLDTVISKGLGENWQDQMKRIGVQADGTTTNYYIDGMPFCSSMHVFSGDCAYAWELRVYDYD